MDVYLGRLSAPGRVTAQIETTDGKPAGAPFSAPVAAGADRVTLDLGGFELSGGGTGLTGIRVNNVNATIRNGTLRSSNKNCPETAKRPWTIKKVGNDYLEFSSPRCLCGTNDCVQKGYNFERILKV